jgi:hypothetical protein
MNPPSCGYAGFGAVVGSATIGLMNPGSVSSFASSFNIPVGTALAGGPPDRSQRAELPHWAPALGRGGEAHVGVGVHDAGGR